MVHKFFESKIPHNGCTYHEYQQMMQNKIENTSSVDLTGKEKKRFKLIKLNKVRSNRIGRFYEVPDELKDVINKIDEHQLCMVITENWGSDSAQKLPYIAKIVALNSKKEFLNLVKNTFLEVV